MGSLANDSGSCLVSSHYRTIGSEPVQAHLPKTPLYDFGQARTGLLAVDGSLDRPFRPTRLFGDFTP